MNAKRVNAAAGVIHASQVKGKQTATGLAADLESACLLQSPEVAAEQVELLAELEQRTELLHVVQEKARRLRAEVDGRKAHGDRLKAENEALRARLVELEAEKERWRKATYRLAGEAGLVPRESPDAITRRIAPVAALREDDPFHLHHEYRLGRDLPQPDAAP
ncbi:hypothetical protein ACFV20_19565 [Streptomyces sp. NPDC059696]|uniref:hypothetical protein n=1 Tax=Streptomyces sp. NPDC059696 TaxID=3346911 RepID=UPI0036CDABA4